jgi:beta-glucosidase
MTQPTLEQRVENLLKQLTLKEKISLLSGMDAWNTVPVERLGVSSLTMTDGPHGVRTSFPEALNRVTTLTTCFPTGVSMAASWNTELVEEVAEALAEETRGAGCDILLGPCVNIVRHPLAGRNFEAYSEDPYLAGKIGVAWVKGLQSKQVGASLKHFACNNQEFERFRGNSVIDERSLREIYLSQFEMVVKEAKPYTVMCSYNRVNGVYASEHKQLLRQILKEEWGFDGVVVSDWTANHTVTASVENGLDLEMPGPARYYGALLEDAVNIWQIEEARIDEAARRILTLLARVGRLDDPAKLPAGSLNTPEHQALARKLAEESITLLKNENSLLPLEPGRVKTIAVIGPNAAEARIGGGGSSYIDPPYRVSPLAALQTRLNGKVDVFYAQGCDNTLEPPTMSMEILSTPDGQPGTLWCFFNNPELAGQPLDTRVAPKLEDYLWSNGGQVAGLTSTRFSLRIQANFVAPESGHYRFFMPHSSRLRLLLDGEVLCDHLSPRSSNDANMAEFLVDLERELTGGQRYELTLELLKDNDENALMFKVGFQRTYHPGEDDRMERAVELAKRCDVALVFAGMPEGYESEGKDRPDLSLPGPQAELIEAVALANPRTVVVLNAGSPVEMPWLNLVPAVLEAYYAGQEGGNAVADILLGNINPSGKLSESFPKRLEDTPAFLDYPGGRDVRYGEGIFVGYRYYEKRQVEPLFPFGFGLSYTRFEYSDLKVTSSGKIGEPVEVSLTVRNSGPRAGKEVIQLYVSDPLSSLVRPVKELKAFSKIDLQPGQSQQVHFQLDQRAFAFYHPVQKNWVAEPGLFFIHVGSASNDIRCSAELNLG